MIVFINVVLQDTNGQQTNMKNITIGGEKNIERIITKKWDLKYFKNEIKITPLRYLSDIKQTFPC